jgi:Ca2+-binding RTX toxin-like protein
MQQRMELSDIVQYGRNLGDRVAESKFPNGNVPAEIIGTLSIVPTALNGMIYAGSFLADVNAGAFPSAGVTPQALASISSDFGPILGWAGGVGLGLAVAADLAKLSYAAEHGTADDVGKILGEMFMGVLAASILVALEAPIGAVAAAYLVGKFAFDHLDTLERWLDVVHDFLITQIDQILEVGDWLQEILHGINLASLLPVDPLVLDLNGDGLGLVGLVDGNAFDFSGDLFKEKTGWVDGNDGILVVDHNLNGLIDDGYEMFGNFGVFDDATGNQVYNSNVAGFDQLATFDSNGDGKVDASDAKFAEIKVWQDANHNGKTDAGELKTLAEVGIASLDVAHETTGVTSDPLSGPTYPDVNGNPVYATGSFTRTDGSTGTIGDVGFERDLVNTVYTGSYTPSLEALLLPSLRGYGHVPDLFVAMCKDPTLLQMVKGLVSPTSDATTYRTQIEAILYQWAGVQDVAPNSRRTIDARDLAFFEKYFDYQFTQMGNLHTPMPNAAAVYDGLWNTLVAELGARLLVQGPLAGILPDVHYDFRTDALTGSFNVSVFETLRQHAPAFYDTMALLQYWNGLLPALNVIKSTVTVVGDYDTALQSAVISSGLPFEYFNNPSQIYHVVSGNVVDEDLSGSLRLDLIDGGDGNDTIHALAGKDIISGAHGNDLLYGGDDDDSYYYVRGDGHDTIIDGVNGGHDALGLLDINAADVSLLRNGNDVTVVIAESSPGAGDGGSILLKSTLDDWFDEGLERIQFADGTIWTRATMRDMLLTSTPGDDVLVGFSTNDTFTYARGDGHDTIIEGTNDGYADRLVLTDINANDVSLLRDGNHVTLEIHETAPDAGDGGSIRLVNNLDDYFSQGVEAVEFADGTTWTRATMRDMLLTSTPGNDTLVGFDTSDTYVYSPGSGHDTIIDYSNSGYHDQLVLANINPSDVLLERNGNDLTLLMPEISGSILVKNTLDDWYGQGVDQFHFADGTTWTRSDVRTMLLEQASTPGNDTITGFNTSDIISGGHGNDTLVGGDGNDTYTYARGDGFDKILEVWNGGRSDTLVFTDILSSEVNIARNGNDVILQVNDSSVGAGDGGSVLLVNSFEDDYYAQGVDSVQFADGTIWSRADVREYYNDFAFA